MPGALLMPCMAPDDVQPAQRSTRCPLRIEGYVSTSNLGGDDAAVVAPHRSGSWQLLRAWKAGSASFDLLQWRWSNDVRTSCAAPACGRGLPRAAPVMYATCLRPFHP